MLGKKLVAALAAGASLLGFAGLAASASAAEAPASQSSITLKNAQYGHVYAAYKLGTLSAKSVDAKTGFASGVSVKTVDELVPALSAAADGLPGGYEGNPLAYALTKVSTLTDQGDDVKDKNSSAKTNTGADARSFSSFMDDLDTQSREGYKYTPDGGKETTIKYMKAADTGVVAASGDVTITGLDAASVYLVTDTYDQASLGKEGKAGVPLLAATTGVMVDSTLTAATGFSADDAFPNVVYTKSVVVNKVFAFKKVDALDTSKGVAGVVFRVTGGPLADGDHRDFTSDENGLVTISLPYSSKAYVITEQTPVDGYKGFFDASHASISVTFNGQNDMNGTVTDNTQCSTANGQTKHCFDANGNVGGSHTFDTTGPRAIWKNVPDTSHFPATGFLGNMAMVAGAAAMVALAFVVAKVSRRRSVEA